MTQYKNILIAVDLHPSCDERIIQRAVELSKTYHANLSILHSVEHINAYGAAQAYDVIAGVEQQLAESAKITLSALAEKYGIPSERQIIEIGPPKWIILEQAKKLNVDLIVIGSHGRHGIRLLLGSTANAVLHHAECDILTIRVKETQGIK